MPPKKKLKAPVQTKLSFQPLSKAPSTLFSVETQGPLRSHMAILDKPTPPTPPPSTTTTTNPNHTHSTSTYSSQSSFTTQPSHSAHSPYFGGKDPDIVHSQNRSHSRSVTPHGFNSGKDSGIIEIMDDSQDVQELQEGFTSLGKRKMNTQLLKDTSGSHHQPVQLDSDSDDELLQKPRSQPQNQPSRPVAKPAHSKPSLLDLMATPPGTQPTPKPQSITGYNAAAFLAGNAQRRPLLSTSNSRTLDDGFSSGSSLENRMQSRVSSREPELALPFSQPSSTPGSYPSKKITTLDEKERQSREQQQQFNLQMQERQHHYNAQQAENSLQSRVATFSQKRSGDFASYSVNKSTKRVLPQTVSGYQPVPISSIHSYTPPPPSRPSSFAELRGGSRSRSSSPKPASAQLFTNTATPYKAGGVEYGRYTTYPKDRTKDGMLLSDEQQHVLDQVVNLQRSVFFTGSAGTGKSVLLRELIFQLRAKYNGKRNDEVWEGASEAVAVTASTGIAACNIGGCTLHSFAGVGLGQEALPVLTAKIRKNGNAIRRWQATKVLIVDEVSMVDADFMDKLEGLARDVRRDARPWGGLQVVLTGDFFQLPPVSRAGQVKFCFEGSAWQQTINLTIQLQQVFRQKDQTFANMLNEMRIGQMTPATISRFQKLSRELKLTGSLRPTELFPLRNQVEESNSRMLQNLTGNVMIFHARDSGPQKDKMEQNCLAPTILKLKVNAQVMLLRNQSGGAGGLVNGSLGVITAFVNRMADNENPQAGSFNSTGEELPLVRFTLEDGKYKDMVVGREEWRIELPSGELQGSRVQIPLGLAWSLSIHKSQGQTLQRVRVDLGKVFEKGQAYVALSRATTLEGLQVLNFHPSKVMVHPKVTEFYSRLRVYKKRPANEDDQDTSRSGGG